MRDRTRGRSRIVALIGGAVFFLGPRAPGACAADAPPFDTLSVDSVLAREAAALDSLLLPESTNLDTTGVDSIARSLDAGGAAAARAHAPEWRGPRGARLALKPLAHSTYDRVEGFRGALGLGAVIDRSFAIDGAAGYGFSNHRWLGSAGARFGHERRGPMVRVEGGVDIVPFGSTPQHGNALLALAAGQDRADYLETRGGRATVWPWRSGESGLAVGYFDREERSVRATTDFHFFGAGNPIRDTNPSIDSGRTRGLQIRTILGTRAKTALLALESGIAGGGLGGDFGYSWQRTRAELRRTLPDGGVLTLVADAAHAGGSAPLQARPLLGGDANLRGYGRLQFDGQSRASARIEYAEGADLIPVLHVRFIPFFDLGTTWGEPRVPGVAQATDAATARALLDGDLRSSFGIGIERRIWIPTLESARLDVVHRNDGARDPWSVWFRLEPFDW